MPITRTEGRSHTNFARKIVAEKLIQERRGWENMVSSKSHEDVRQLGLEHLENYRSLMLSVTSFDLLNTDASNVNTAAVTTYDKSIALLNSLTRYLLLEMTMDEMTILLEDIARSIIQWNISTKGSVFVYRSSEFVDANLESDFNEAVDLLSQALSDDLNYVTMILMSDLHHLTFVASADACFEILLSI